MPVVMSVPKITVINGIVYVGGGEADDDDDKNLVSTYDPVKDVWDTLPPAPVRWFGVGRLNGKLVLVGGVYMYKDEDGITGDVHVFEEDTQQWVKSIPPVPAGLAASVVASHSSPLVVCGSSSPLSVFIYSSQSSQWHSRSPPPFTFVPSFFSSAVVVNDTYYISAGPEGGLGSDSLPSSAAVYSIPLSTLLDPNAPQDCSTWQRLPDTPCHTSHLAATGGCLLALGGLRNACHLRDSQAIASNLTTAVHAYCPATSSWVKIGDLPGKRLLSAITTLSSGELFIAGGVGTNDERKKAFIGIIS